MLVIVPINLTKWDLVYLSNSFLGPILKLLATENASLVVYVILAFYLQLFGERLLDQSILNLKSAHMQKILQGIYQLRYKVR